MDPRGLQPAAGISDLDRATVKDSLSKVIRLFPSVASVDESKVQDHINKTEAIIFQSSRTKKDYCDMSYAKLLQLETKYASTNPNAQPVNIAKEYSHTVRMQFAQSRQQMGGMQPMAGAPPTIPLAATPYMMQAYNPSNAVAAAAAASMYHPSYAALNRAPGARPVTVGTNPAAQAPNQPPAQPAVANQQTTLQYQQKLQEMEAKYVPDLSKLIQSTQAMAAKSPSNPKIQNIKNQLVALYSLLKGKSKNVPMNIEILEAAEKRILLWLSKWNPNAMQQQQQHTIQPQFPNPMPVGPNPSGMPPGMAQQHPRVAYPMGPMPGQNLTPGSMPNNVKPPIMGTPHMPQNYPSAPSAPIIPSPNAATPVPHPTAQKPGPRPPGYPAGVNPTNAAAAAAAVRQNAIRPPTPTQYASIPMPPSDSTPTHVSPAPVATPQKPSSMPVGYPPVVATAAAPVGVAVTHPGVVRPIPMPATMAQYANQPRTSKARLEKFVDLFCESSQDTKVLVPALENILNTFQSGPGNPSKDDFHSLSLRDLQSKKPSFFWWDNRKEPNGELCGRKRPRQVLFIQSTQEHECFQEADLCWLDSKLPSKKRHLCHFSANFHLSYEQRKLKDMVNSDSSFVVEEPSSSPDDQQNCTNNKFFVGLRSNTADSDSKVVIEFAPVHNSTLPTDPAVPYLPSLSAHVQIQGQEQNCLLDTVECLSSQLLLCKSMNKRIAELQKELKALSDCYSIVFLEDSLFGLDFISLECTLINIDVPPVILNVPLNYPRVSAQCIFPKQYDNVTHLQTIQSTFESTILTKPFREILTVGNLLGVFRNVCLKVLENG